MAIVGLIGGPLCFSAAAVPMFTTTNGHTTKLTAVLTVPEIVWEVFVSIYLRFHGLKQSPILGADRRVTVNGNLATSIARSQA